MRKAEKQIGDVGVLNHLEEWKLRAKRIRVIAGTMLDAASRESLLQVAQDGEEMVALALDNIGSEQNIAPEPGMTLVPEASTETTQTLTQTPIRDHGPTPNSGIMQPL